MNEEIMEMIEKIKMDEEIKMNERLFKLLKQSKILEDDYKYEIMQAFVEVRSLEEWEELVEEKGKHWDDDIHLYKRYNWYDLGEQAIEDCYQIPDFLKNYIDYEEYAKNEFYFCEEYSNGIIEIL